MPCFAGSGNIQVAQVNNTWYGQVGREAGRQVEGQVGTTQEEGKMGIGTLRNCQSGKTQSRKVVGVRNIHSGPGSIHEWYEKVVVRPVWAVWANTGVGGEGIGRIHPLKSYAHTLVHN